MHVQQLRPRILQLRARRRLTGEEVVEDGQVETATVDDDVQVQPCRRDAPSMAPPLLLSPRAGADKEVVVDDGNGGRRRERSLPSAAKRKGDRGIGGAGAFALASYQPLATIVGPWAIGPLGRPG